jgi:ABC-type antimicrobial peptide transport system permease subunit
MESARFKTAGEVVPHRADGYLLKDGQYVRGEPSRPAIIAANGGVMMNVVDFARWDEQLLGATYARDRQAMIALLVFAGTAIFLAVLSVYGVLAQRVRERSREIGIRMALGADASSLVGWVARAGLRLIAVGLAAGLLAAWALSGSLDRLLFGVAPTDPLTVAGVVGLLSGIGLVATVVPSWRATRIDPVTILRQG